MSDHPLPAPLLDRTIELLRALCALSSPSGDAAGIEAVARLLGGALQRHGFSIEIASESGAGGPQPVLVAERPGARNAERPGARNAERAGARSAPLLLLGHLDTVLEAVPPRLERDRLVATGAIDMKGGLAALLGALELAAQRGDRVADDLLLVLVPDEEIAGPISHRAVGHYGDRARAVWVLEPGQPAAETDVGEVVTGSNRGDGDDAGDLAGMAETMVAGRRGTFFWRVEMWGRAAHSGLHYWQGRSALAAAARFAVAAVGLSRPGTGPTVNAGRLIAGDSSFVENLATHHDLLGTERQINVVPDRALIEGEARFLRAADGERVAAQLAELARALGAECEVRTTWHRGDTVPPVDPDGPQRAWCARAVALAAARGWRLAIEDQRGGISFPNFLRDPGRVPVLDGLGPVGGGMHTRDEFVYLRSLERRIVLLADLLAADGGSAS